MIKKELPDRSLPRNVHDRMGRGRKNSKKEALEGCFEIPEGQTVMQVVSSRGSNLIELMDDTGFKTLALFPAKFHKSLWIKRGNYVLVEESDRERALEAGSKVTCVILQVLFEEQVRTLRKSSSWPQGFNVDKRSTVTATSGSDANVHKIDLHSEKEQYEEYSSDEGLPPLEANCNRRYPQELHVTSNEEETSDSDS